jgi:hypothetical protein
MWENQSSTEPINGLHIRHCSGTPETDQCNNSKDQLQKLGLLTVFTLTAPEAKKYYLKIDIDAHNMVVLKPQEGLFGLTSGTYKYSLKGNIKKNQISKPRNAPTQRMPLPWEVPAPTDMPPALPSTNKPAPSGPPAPTDMPPALPSETPSSFVIKKTTAKIPTKTVQESQPSQSQNSLMGEIRTIIQNGPAEFAKPADQRRYKKPADFHTTVMEKIGHVTNKTNQEDLKALFGAAYPKVIQTHNQNKSK